VFPAVRPGIVRLFRVSVSLATQKSAYTRVCDPSLDNIETIAPQPQQ